MVLHLLQLKYISTYDVNSQECCRLLSSMLLGAREMDNEYVEKCYDINMALLNNGGLTVANTMFFEWAKHVMDTIWSKFNIGILELDPKHAFEKARISILSEKMLKGRFMTICNLNKLCRESVATEVYADVLPKTIHARFAVVFWF